MSHHAVILGLAEYEIKAMRWSGGQVELEVCYAGPTACPHCGSVRLRKKDRYVRRVRHESWGMRQVTLLLHGVKFHCRDGGRYFHQRFPGIRPRRRSSERFRSEVFLQHYDGITRKRLAARAGVSTATIEPWFHDFLGRQAAERSSERCPRVLGIDEHFFTKRKGYATTFCDLSKRRVFDVALGRSEASLERYVRRMKGKERVQVVCIDLSSTYRSLIRKHFPNARIVADRFHVIRLVNHHFLATWRSLDETGSRNRGLISLMRRHEEHLNPEQHQRRGAYLDRVPGLRIVYEEKQRLTRLLRHKHRTQAQARKLIPELLEHIDQLKHCGLAPLETLGSTLASWSEEIACMGRFTRNNGITEGFHNKMEMISRRAFGFRNVENYRLRVSVLCS